MAWMRMMGVDSVEYHRATVLDRQDDHPGAALAYYAERGESPLTWGGGGASRLGLAGNVTPEHYEDVFGPGGARHPVTGGRLVRTKRPGLELVVSVHKTVAELGVIGRAEDMHRILDAERDGTLAYLETLTRERGGRRGRAATATPTSGLFYATTRHATSRAGDPCLHDHVLIANIVEMLDERGDGRRLTLPYGASTFTPPRPSGGCVRLGSPSISATGSSPMMVRPAASDIGRSRASPTRRSSCIRSGPATSMTPWACRRTAATASEPLRPARPDHRRSIRRSRTSWSVG
jgi:hypothetical protein